ncbi:MAG: glycosyltransferase N-terminal domain-containing protein [Henriciella sp.]|nr:glycosyltransferase N-terminal domain-containing protein [Henriciella sp.]
MQIGLFLYKCLTWIISPFLGMVMKTRVRNGKEHADRVNERFAKDLSTRPDGKLIWFHAASVGESLIQLELIERLVDKNAPHFSVLITCQTATAAQRISDRIISSAFGQTITIQQMAPLDTAAVVKRFLDHWQPNACVYAEGEIWPNQLLEIERRRIPTALINARMTQKSIEGWARWPRTASRVFGVFTAILISDSQTQLGLQGILKHPLPRPGNLKSALPPPDIDAVELQNWTRALTGRRVLLAASTHSPEERSIVEAWQNMTEPPFLIIAPRHPERGEELANMLEEKQVKFTRLTESRAIIPGSNVLLADTLGEMGLWYRLADTVYLGGGHAPNIGGHNPLEALQLNKPVVTGPDQYNFRDMEDTLAAYVGYTVIVNISDLSEHFPAPAPSPEMMDYLSRTAEAPMQETLQALRPMLAKAGL